MRAGSNKVEGKCVLVMITKPRVSLGEDQEMVVGDAETGTQRKDTNSWCQEGRGGHRGYCKQKAIF